VPELPEVETVVRDLRPLVTGRRVLRVEAGDRKLRTPWEPAWGPTLVGKQVAAVRRRGKWILLDLDGGAVLVVHLGMTGRFTVERADAARELHTHLVFALDGAGDELRFRDPRRFGSARLFADAAAVEELLAAKLGPEPWNLGAKEWRAALRGTARPLKAVLLDQRVVAGVGNIYADESLHAARLHPTQPGERTTAAQAERLRAAVVAVLERAIESRGSTIRDYVGGDGQKGGYQDEFRVYGRTGEPCPRCGRAVECIRLAGRSTHYCPKCQKRAVSKHKSSH
jgi:formamidopyrimidine-DNA glycosylase